MGVPKFFKFISERWPLISKLIDEDQIPEFDNLYLDMNSILHNCTHSSGQNYDDLTESLSEDEVYTSIFAYIDHLFNTIKPKKVFYMAIDGVAPRAKMNQQRSRRFRTALEAETQRKQQQEQEDLTGIDSGKKEKDPSKAFDSNAITPGTEFMATLSKHLKFFIHKKVTTDANWQNIDVIYSGHEVPGEGEHKIMKYIRTMKLQPDYDSNLRHCIYGLDADLIMLGMVTHDPHFCLLREEVKFGPQRGDKSKGGSTLKSLEEEKFYLLHLSLLREYLELEFSDLKNFLKFNYNFEKLLDDFILIMYVIGNDFLPNLPDLHINKGAFPLLLKTFKKFLINSDGYLNEDGKINFPRFKIWLDYLSLFEYENFENGHVDIDWFNKKLDNLSLNNENKKKLIELKKKRFEEQNKKSAKLANKTKLEVLKQKQRQQANAAAAASAASGFGALKDDVESADEDEFDLLDSKLEEFRQFDLSDGNHTYNRLFSFVEPWLLNIYSTDSARIDVLNITDDEIPELGISNRLVSDNESLPFEFLKQIAYDFDLIIVQDNESGSISLKLDIGGIDPNETVEEYQERIQNYHELIEKYAAKFGQVTEKDIAELNKQIQDSDNNDIQFENLTSYLEDEKFVDWKNAYYTSKFGFNLNNKEEFSKLAHNYLEGLQWVLYYYYKGCPSWSWYYKYHFPPRISDISAGITEDSKIEFPKDKPFTPFQQLMGVLPARSNLLLPKVYRPLMLDPNSPIIDFYPNEVEVDKNGKTAEWEYVLKLSFVDQDRLVLAMKPIESKLTPEEKHRNSFGPDLVFKFNSQIERFYKSSLPNSFRDLEGDHCIELVFELPPIDPHADKKNRGDDDYYSEDLQAKAFNHLCRGAKTGTELLSGFPTLQTIPFSHQLAIDYLVLFNFPSRSESMILTLNNPHKDLLEDASIEDICEKYLGKIIYSNWPFLKESKVVSISDGLISYSLDSNKRIIKAPLDDTERSSFNDNAKNMVRTYHINKGIKIGKVELIFTTVATNGLIRNKEGAYVKTFTKKQETYPFQLIVDDVVNKDERFQERPPKPINVEFPVNTKVTFLGDIAYGNEATVLGYKSNTELVLQVSKVSKDEEPNIGAQKAYNERHSLRYFTSGEAAQQLRLHPLFLSKLTSSYLIENAKGKRVNIGLDLKFEGKKLKVLGFTRRTDRGWTYSSLALSLIDEYRNLFPTFFRNLANASKGNQRGGPLVNIQDLYPKETDPLKLDDKLKKILDYLETKKSKFNTTTLASESLNRGDIADIEEYTIQYISKKHNEITKNLKGVPIAAILDNQNSQQLLKKQFFNLGDRVVNVLDSGKVPLFAKGTIVGINVLDEKVSLNVVFDYPLINGNSLNGRLRSTRGMVVEASHLLNLTHKQFIYHSKASLEKSKHRAPYGKDYLRHNQPASNKGNKKPPVNAAASKPKPKADKKELSKEEKERLENEAKEKEAGKRALLTLLKRAKGGDEDAQKAVNENEGAVKALDDKLKKTKKDTKAPAAASADTASVAKDATKSTQEDKKEATEKASSGGRNIDNDKAAKEVYGAIMNGLLSGGNSAPASAPPAPGSLPPPSFSGPPPAQQGGYYPPPPQHPIPGVGYPHPFPPPPNAAGFPMGPPPPGVIPVPAGFLPNGPQPQNASSNNAATTELKSLLQGIGALKVDQNNAGGHPPYPQQAPNGVNGVPFYNNVAPGQAPHQGQNVDNNGQGGRRFDNNNNFARGSGKNNYNSNYYQGQNSNNNNRYQPNNSNFRGGRGGRGGYRGSNNKGGRGGRGGRGGHYHPRGGQQNQSQSQNQNQGQKDSSSTKPADGSGAGAQN